MRVLLRRAPCCSRALRPTQGCSCSLLSVLARSLAQPPLRSRRYSRLHHWLPTLPKCPSSYSERSSKPLPACTNTDYIMPAHASLFTRVRGEREERMIPGELYGRGATGCH